VSRGEGISISQESSLSRGAIGSLIPLVGLLAFSQVPALSQSATVTITNPQNGATVKKVVNVSGSWSGTANVYKLDLLCDSNVVQSQNISPAAPSGNFSFSWDSRTTSNGSHTLTVKAYAGYSPGGQASVSVQVANTLPQITISQPQPNASVQGYVNVSGSWSGDYNVWKVELLCDGSSITSQTIDPAAESGNFSFTWDSTTVPNGSHTLTIKTYIQGQYGGASQNSVSIQVSNPQPQVTILSPSDGATLNSISHITARATWIKELTQIMLWIDGCGYQWQSVSSSDVAVTFDIDTTAFQDGSHSIKVIASGGPQWTWGMAEISVNFNNRLGSFPFYAMMGNINLSSGNYHTSSTDISIPGRGLGLHFERTYNSLDPQDGPLGFGWRHNYQMQLLDHPQGGKLFIDDAGGRIKFTDNGDGTYSPPPGIHLQLSQNPDGTWQIRKKDGTKFIFSPDGLLLAIIDANYNQVSLNYNGGILAFVVDPSGRQLTFSYNGGRITAIQDPAGRVFTFDYDTAGNLKKVIYPDGGSITYSYDAYHHLTTITDQLGRTTNITYDSMGRVAQIISPLNNATSYYYYPAYTQTVDPLGNTYTTYYDSAGRPVREVDPLGYYVLKSWDSNNNLVSITDKAGKTTNMQYDEYGNLTEITDPMGYTTQYTYEYTYHKPTSKTDALGRTTNLAYDSRGNLTSVTLPSGRQITYTYNDYGLMTSMTDPAGHSTSFQYDVYGNMISLSDSLGNTEHYTYNILGWKLTETDALGRTKSYSYDPMGRLTNISYPDGSSISYSYNLAGEKTAMVDWRGQTSFVYDSEGKLIKKIEPYGKFIEYSYDAAGRLVAVRNQAGKTTYYGYNARGDIVWMKDEGGRQVSFLYDPVGRLTRANFPNGIFTNYNYNANGWLTSLVSSRASGGTVASFSYSYNAIGKKVSCLDDKGREVDWGYDVDGQLISELWKNIATGEILYQQSFAYDPAGNRTYIQNSLWGNISYQYDQANRLLQAGDISYTWDANGNQLQKITPQGTWSYVYDYENRLLKVIHPDGGMTEFAYAGAGYDRVWMRKKNGEEIFFTYDGDKTTAEFSAQGALLRAYRYGPQVVWMEEGGNIFFLHADGQGSVRLVTNLSGQVVAEYSYDAFGNQLEGEEGWNPFKYCGIFGYREDEETALMKVGARYYDPTIGRWIQKDPILDGFNWWIYCENDPVNGVDPKGTQARGKPGGGAPGFPPEWGSPYYPPPYRPYPGTPCPGKYGGTPYPCTGACTPECLGHPTPPFGGGKPICGRSAHLSLVFAVFLIVDRLRRRKDDV